MERVLEERRPENVAGQGMPVGMCVELCFHLLPSPPCADAAAACLCRLPCRPKPGPRFAAVGSARPRMIASRFFLHIGPSCALGWRGVSAGVFCGFSGFICRFWSRAAGAGEESSYYMRRRTGSRYFFNY